MIASLGVDRRHRGRQLGDRLLAQALLDCHKGGSRIPFVAVVIDCLDATAKAFFQRYDFREFPGAANAPAASQAKATGPQEHQTLYCVSI